MHWTYYIISFGLIQIQATYQQQPIKISLQTALQKHNETLELISSFNYFDNARTIDAHIGALMPCILHEVPANRDLFCLNSMKMAYITKIKHLKSFIKRFGKSKQQTQYLILWPNNQLPYGGNYTECNRIMGMSIINCFIMIMHKHIQYVPIYSNIQYMFLITGQRRDRKLHLHYGDFNKFVALFPAGSILNQKDHRYTSEDED